MDRLTSHLRSAEAYEDSAVTKSDGFYGGKLAGLEEADRVGIIEYCASHGYTAEFVTDQLGGIGLRIRRRRKSPQITQMAQIEANPERSAKSAQSADKRTFDLIHG